MRIAVFGTDATHGGASRAMRRLIAGLSRRGHEVDLVCLTPDPGMTGCLAVRRRVKSDPENAMDDAALRLFNECYVRERRTAVSNTLFAPQLIGYALADSGLLEAYDAFNIHWVSHFLSIHGIAEIAALGKPVALTLHDMNFFTGGCHYSAGCRGYAADCHDCPQLHDDPLDLPAAVLRSKRRLYAEPNVTPVAPTRWLGGCAAESGVFREGGVTVIPNSIETDVFVPGAKEVAKAAIGLDPGIKTLLFGTYNNGEHRKGFDHLAEVLRHMRADARIEALRRSGGIRVLAFGRSTPDLAAADYPFHELGLIDDDARLATAYSAADVFVLPSREDNQPNVMLEAMACGTPPVAFGVGGIPETITDGVNGRMIQGFDTAAMAGALTELLFDPAPAAAMARAARKTIEERYPLDLQAARYEALLRAMGAKTAAAAERVRRGLAGGAVSPGQDGSRFVEAPLSVPVDLKTGVYGFALNQQGKLDTAEAELRRLRAVVHQHEREQEALSARLDAILFGLTRSTSWKATRALRGRRGRATPGSRPDADRPVSAREKLAEVMTLVHSTSWEMMAPVRLLHRAADRLWRRLRHGLLP
ncbi:MAG: glycosyltransferase [Gammaproteobacteria bacterium]